MNKYILHTKGEKVITLGDEIVKTFKGNPSPDTIAKYIYSKGYHTNMKVPCPVWRDYLTKAITKLIENNAKG